MCVQRSFQYGFTDLRTWQCVKFQAAVRSWNLLPVRELLRSLLEANCGLFIGSSRCTAQCARFQVRVYAIAFFALFLFFLFGFDFVRFFFASFFFCSFGVFTCNFSFDFLHSFLPFSFLFTFIRSFFFIGITCGEKFVYCKLSSLIIFFSSFK